MYMFGLRLKVGQKIGARRVNEKPKINRAIISNIQSSIYY